MTAQVNSDGLHIKFGRDRSVRGVATGVTRTAGKGNELCLDVTLTGAARTIYPRDRNNDGTNDGFVVGIDTPIPAGARINEVIVIETVAPAGGTSYSVGTFVLAGTATDADGLWTDAGAAGAQVGTKLAVDGYVTIKTIGVYTAGQVKVIVRYDTV